MKAKKLIPIAIMIGMLSYFGYKYTLASETNKNIYYGTIEAETINVVAETQGKIVSINVEEGQRVKIGDIVAGLNDAESKIKLDIANIAKENAQNELNKVEKGNRAEEINAQKAIVSQCESQVSQGEALLKQAQNNLELAKLNLDVKKKNYDNSKTMFEKNLITQNELDLSKNQYDAGVYSYENAKEHVEYANAQLNAFKAQLKAAKEKLNLLVNGATDNTKLSAKLNLNQAEKSAELTKLNGDKNIIKAPIDGVVETVNFKKGEFVNVGSPIATILDTSNMYVTVYVAEKDLPKIKLGQAVKLKSDFIKDKNINGKVTYISSEAEFTPMNIVTKEDRTKLVFKVKIKVLDNLDLVKPGMLMDVYLE